MRRTASGRFAAAASSSASPGAGARFPRMRSPARRRRRCAPPATDACSSSPRRACGASAVRSAGSSRRGTWWTSFRSPATRCSFSPPTACSRNGAVAPRASSPHAGTLPSASRTRARSRSSGATAPRGSRSTASSPRSARMAGSRCSAPVRGCRAAGRSSWTGREASGSAPSPRSCSCPSPTRVSGASCTGSRRTTPDSSGGAATPSGSRRGRGPACSGAIPPAGRHGSLPGSPWARCARATAAHCGAPATPASSPREDGARSRPSLRVSCSSAARAPPTAAPGSPRRAACGTRRLPIARRADFPASRSSPATPRSRR